MVEADQDKVRSTHWVPLLPSLVESLTLLIDERDADELMYDYHSYAMWIKRQKVPLTRVKSHFVLGDMRKWCFQYGCDTLGWELSNVLISSPMACRVLRISTIVTRFPNRSMTCTLVTGKRYDLSNLSSALGAPLSALLLARTASTIARRSGDDRKRV